MQRINKTTSAPLAAGFFILSLAIMPFSLKVVGLTLSLNPSMSAVVDVWNEIAGSLGSEYQPATPAELIAINNLDSNQAPDAVTGAATEIALLAKLEQGETGQMYQPLSSDVEVEDFNMIAPQARSRKAASHKVKRAVADSNYRELQARIRQQADALRAAEAAQREIAANAERLKGLDKQVAAIRFDVGKMMKGFTFNKDVKVQVKMKRVTPVPVVPKLTACDLRTALTGGKKFEAREREAHARLAESTITSFENCEL